MGISDVHIFRKLCGNALTVDIDKWLISSLSVKNNITFIFFKKTIDIFNLFAKLVIVTIIDLGVVLYGKAKSTKRFN